MNDKIFYQRFREIREIECKIRNRVPVVELLAQAVLYGKEVSAVIESRMKRESIYQDLFLAYLDYRNLRDSLPEDSNLRSLPEAMMQELSLVLHPEVLSIAARH